VAFGLLFLVGFSIAQLGAAPFLVPQEAEAGLRAGLASRCADTTASNSATVTFGLANCQTVPTGQIVTWNETNNGPGGAWHRLAKLADGSWLRVLTVFPAEGRTELRIYRSVDNLRSWQVLAAVDDGQRLVDNGFLYLLPNGELLLAARNNIISSSYKISQWRSADNGITWVRETDPVAATKGLWEPEYHSSANGLAITWSDESQDGLSQVIRERTSADNGKTWSDPMTIVSDGPSGRPGMSTVTKMANGKYLLAYEVCGTQGCVIFNKQSDDGSSWPDGIGTPIPGAVCGPFITSLSDGRVILTACRKSDADQTVPVVYSNDFGVTWQSNDSAFTDAGQYGGWPSLYQVGPDEIAAVSDGRIRFGTLAPRVSP